MPNCSLQSPMPSEYTFFSEFTCCHFPPHWLWPTILALFCCFKSARLFHICGSWNQHHLWSTLLLLKRSAWFFLLGKYLPFRYLAWHPCLKWPPMNIYCSRFYSLQQRLSNAFFLIYFFSLYTLLLEYNCQESRGYVTLFTVGLS